MNIFQSQGHAPLRLRWVFWYVTKPTKYGMWNDSVDQWTTAALQSREGLLRVGIESQDVNAATRVEVDCPGADFRMFQWEAVANLGATVQGGIAGMSTPRNIGLSLLTTDTKTTVYIDGTVTEKEFEYMGPENGFAYGKEIIFSKGE